MVFGIFKKEEAGFDTIRGANVLVTGACGLAGARLVEICLERSAKNVLAVDFQSPDEAVKKRFWQ